MFKLIISCIVAIIFIGCSSKQYFEPENIVGYYDEPTKDMPEYIKSLNKDGAVLENYKIISKDGISKLTLPKNYIFLNKNKDTIISANNAKQLLLSTNDENTTLTFKKDIIAASINQNLLALIFKDNSLGIFDIEHSKFKFKQYQKPSPINDNRIANPIFLDDITLFPTLNGKIVIVDNTKFNIIKSIKIDPNNKINNVIFLKTIDNTMIAATSNKIIVLGSDSFVKKDYTIKDIIVHNKNIYLATLEGEIIKLDFILDEIGKKKFKFAKIHALGYGTKLYALESQEFLIAIDENFSNIKVYDFDFDEESKVIVIDNILYFDDEYIKLR